MFTKKLISTVAAFLLASTTFIAGLPSAAALTSDWAPDRVSLSTEQYEPDAADGAEPAGDAEAAGDAKATPGTEATDGAGLVPGAELAGEARAESEAEAADAANTGGSAGSDASEDQIIVTFDNSWQLETKVEAVKDDLIALDAEQESISTLAARDTGSLTSDSDALELTSEVVTEDANMGSIVAIEVPQSVSVEEAIAAALQEPSVVAAQPNYSYELLEDDEASSASLTTSATANDLYANNSTSPYYQWWLDIIGARRAWDKGAVTNGAVTIAVLDTGCRLTHNDLRANLNLDYAYDAVNKCPLTPVSRKYNGSPNGDTDGHGTHVAGIIGAVANNNTMFAGVSYNAKILPVAIFGEDKKGSTLTALEGINYLKRLKGSGALANLRVVNMSFGTQQTGGTGDPALHLAIQQLEDLGVLFVAAAGNNGSSAAIYPSDFPEVVSVVAIDKNKNRWSSSDYNANKNISAPGVGVYSTSNTTDDALASRTGTSMASPMVAGAAALLWAVNPSLNVAQVKERLYSTAEDLGVPGKDEKFGHGLVNIEAALSATINYSGVYTIAPSAAPNMVFDVKGGDVGNAIPLWLYTSNTTPAQRFTLDRVKNVAGVDYYRIICVNSGKVLDIPGNRAVSGNAMQQYTWNGSDAQLFSLEPDGNGAYYLHSKTNPALVLDLRGGAMASGTTVQLYNQNRTAAQRFVLNKFVDRLPSGEYTVVSALPAKNVLDVAGNGKNNGTNVHTWRSNGTAAQRFRFVYDVDTGYYTIIGVGSGKCLDIAGGNSDNGANVQIYQSNKTKAQKWTAVQNGDGTWTFFSALSGKVLDIAGAGQANGSNLQAYRSNGTLAQKWTLAA